MAEWIGKWESERTGGWIDGHVSGQANEWKVNGYMDDFTDK